MTQSKIRITVDWYCEPDLENAGKNIERLPNPFLYLCLGKVKYQRRNMLQSFGCSKSFGGVLYDKDVRLIATERQIWFGFVTTFEPSAQNHQSGPSAVCCASSIYQKALKFRNTRFSASHDLVESAEVFNRWWRFKTIFARKASPHIDWPDVIEHNGLNGSISTMKFGETRDSVINSTHFQKVETLPPHLKHWE